jgi:hypothetical protein
VLLVNLTLARKTGKFLRGRGQIVALISPQFTEVDGRELGNASFVFFSAHFYVR